MFFRRNYKPDFTPPELRAMADAVRALSIDQVQAAQSGHLGAPLGMADVITTVFANHLRFNPNAPDWPGRDRFVLSAGHASAMLYATLYLSGYDVSIDDLRAFRQFGARAQGHPEYGAIPGIETSTGPLGQGLANAVGMALAAKRRESTEIRDQSKVYCLCSDGDLMEGISQEAISLAGYYKLDNLIVLWDNNGITIDGAAATADDVHARFLSADWSTVEIDGMNPYEIDRAIGIAKRMGRPTMIACRTTIGYLSERSGTADAHGSPLTPDDAAAVLEKIRPGGGAFTVTPVADNLWARMRNIKINTITTSGRNVTDDVFLDTRDIEILPNIAPSTRPESTRKIFGRAIKIAMAQMPETLVGGSADLTENTHARPDIARDITPGNFDGNYIRYGVREHAMGAIMNGLALSGLRPYGSTFLAFSDYMRPSIRLSAIMKLPVLYVFSHDSIALGEDGITHQPVEQLASLRLIPNLWVMRPASAAEMAVCMELALRRKDGPCAMILSRQDFPIVPNDAAPDDIEKGGYFIKEAKGRKVTLIATGSEVPLALIVAEILNKKKIATAVVAMPCVEKFRLQPDKYKRTILAGYTVAIEAGASRAWHEFADDVFGIDTFGAGGPGAEVYRNFGFDADKIAGQIMCRVQSAECN